VLGFALRCFGIVAQAQERAHSARSDVVYSPVAARDAVRSAEQSGHRIRLQRTSCAMSFRPRSRSGLPRRAEEISTVATRSRADLQPGDLVSYDTASARLLARRDLHRGGRSSTRRPETAACASKDWTTGTGGALQRGGASRDGTVACRSRPRDPGPAALPGAPSALPILRTAGGAVARAVASSLH